MTFFTTIGSWLSTSGLRICLILLGAYALDTAIRVSIEQLVRRLAKPDFAASAEGEEKRKVTLARVLNRTFATIFYGAVAMMILGELGLNIAPLLAGAGIVGVAIGFGSQQLVRDYISGLFIILENRYRVGDAVMMNGVTGIVEDVTLRMTRIRDVDGALHYIQNGSITTCANLSTEGGRIHATLKVSAKANLDRARSIVQEVGQSLASDEATKTSVRRPPTVARVDGFDADWVTLRISGDADVRKQLEITSEFILRLKKALDAEGIVASVGR